MKSKIKLSTLTLGLMTAIAFGAPVDKFDTITTNSPSKLKVDFLKGINFTSTDSLKLPVGTTAQRDVTPGSGMLRLNSTTNTLEAYAAAAWRNLLTFTTNLSVPVEMDMNSHKIVNVTDPTSAQEAATKNYVDNATAAIDLTNYVDRSTTQSVAGNKTFTGTVTASNPIAGSITGNAATVTTNANLTGQVTSVGNATTLTNSAVTGQPITGYSSAAGVISATDSILTAINKLNGNIASAGSGTITGPIAVSGGVSSVTSQTGTGSKFVMDTSPTLVTPDIGVATATSVNGTVVPASKTLVVTTDKLSVHAATTSAELAGVISDETGTGSVVYSTSPTLVTPALGTPSALVGTNITGTAAGLTAGTVTTNANLTGEVLSTGNVTTVPTATVINKTLSGYAAAPGTVTSSDTILSALQKIDANNGTNANLTGEVTSVGNATTVTNAAVTGKVITGYVSGAGTVAATDTIVQAINKLDGNSQLKLGNTKGQSEGAVVSTTEIDVPYNQLTTTATGVRLLDTNNSNMLINPGFEGADVVGLANGWTNSGSSPSITAGSTAKIQGVQAQVLTMAAQTLQFQQLVSTIGGVNGQQAIVSAYVYAQNTVQNAMLCSIVNSLEQSCVPINTYDRFVKYEIPTTLGSTNVGIRIKTTGAATGFLIVDNAFAGLGLPGLGSIGNAKLLGTIQMSGCSARWNNASTTMASFGAQTGCVYSTTGSALAPLTNIPAIRFASIPAGVIKIEYEGVTGNNVLSKDSSYQVWDGTNVSRDLSTYAASIGGGSVAGSSVNSSLEYSSAQSNVTLELRGRTTSGGNVFLSAIANETSTIKVWYFPPSNQTGAAYSATNGNYKATPYTPTFTGFGTVSNVNCTQARDGDVLKVKCNFTTGTTTATEARVSFPGALVTPSTLPAVGLVGQLETNVVGGVGQAVGSSFGVYVEPSVGYFTFGTRSSLPATGLVKQTGTQMGASNTLLSFYAEVPINGWDNSNQIIGSFEGIEKCATTAECLDTMSALMDSAGNTTLQSTTGWLSGNCVVSGTSVFDCPINTAVVGNTLSLNCWATGAAAAASGALPTYDPNNSTASLARFRTQNSTSGTLQAFSAMIVCQKRGTDSKPKTAKIASSIGVPTVPGITGVSTGDRVDTFSFSYGTTNASTVCSSTPCSYIDQIGNAVLSQARTGTGLYAATFSKTYLKVKCSLNSAGATTTSVPYLPLTCSNCNTLSFQTYSMASGFPIVDTYGTLMCQGTY